MLGGGHGACANPIFDFQKIWVQSGSVAIIFVPMLCASGMLGQHRHHVGLMLGLLKGILWFVLAFVGQELGSYWVYFWTFLGHFGLCWGILGYVGTILGSC